MSRIRSQETAPEKAVRSELHRRGFRFRKNVEGLPGTPDIVLPKYRTVVFVNGCFWHQHENCSYAVMPKSNAKYWEPKLQGNVARDKKRVEALTELGWQVVTLWECEVKEDCERYVSTRIVDNLNRRPKV